MLELHYYGDFIGRWVLDMYSQISTKKVAIKIGITLK
jgi:hypothetical protein